MRSKNISSGNTNKDMDKKHQKKEFEMPDL
jgi:hypothetical protein